MKKLMALALSLIFVFSMTALAEDDSLKRMTDSGKLILGLDDSFPPMGFNNEKGEIVGFDIDGRRADGLHGAQAGASAD